MNPDDVPPESRRGRDYFTEKRCRPISRIRCSLCGLPDTYPGISFDGNGVCSLCSRPSAPERPYAGEHALRQQIHAVLSQPRNARRPYDAAVAFSGGRDSACLLYYAREVLGLSVLAVTLTHDFIPQETVDSIERICSALGVELHWIPNQALNRCSTECVQAWAQTPEAASLVSFCTGCRYGIKRLIPAFCRQEGIPLLLVGNTRMEQMTYRQELLSADPRRPHALNKLRGYAGCLARNPALLGSLRCSCVQAYEYAYPLARKVVRDRRLTVLAPFRDYLTLSDSEQAAILSSVGWQHSDCFRSPWRADCYVNILLQYFYQKLLGFNDLDVHLAELLRRQEITRQAAEERRMRENGFDEPLIAELMRFYYDVDLHRLLALLPPER